jgi:hypothetical protein
MAPAAWRFRIVWEKRASAPSESRLALLCSAAGYVLLGASGFVFSLLSDKSLVEMQHIIGTG